MVFGFDWFVDDGALGLEVLEEVVDRFREVFGFVGRGLGGGVAAGALFERVFVLVEEFVDEYFSEFFLFRHRVFIDSLN